MKITKLITPYGIINNPSEMVARMVLRNPYNAKSIVNKSFEKSMQYLKENGIKLVHVTSDKLDIKA